MLNVKSVDETMRIIKDNFHDIAIEDEVIKIQDAAGRITSDNIVASHNVPEFNRSSVDGYAVISSDTFGSSDATPAQLRLDNDVKIETHPGFSLSKGHASYIPTGGELPENTDSVVMIEYTENYDDGFIYINKPTAPGNNVIFKGDDIVAGNTVIQQGSVLRPQDIGVMAASGYKDVKVKKKIKVGIISTGNELIDISQEITGAKIRDINSYSLYSGIVSYGGHAKSYGIVNDDYNKILEKTQQALEECDVVLISGGSSVGNKDETYNVIKSMGETSVLVHGIAVKPGKPTIIGKVKGKAVIGLPGHPGSAYMIFRIFVCHLLDVINNIKRSKYGNSIQAQISSNYPSNNGREEFLPVKLHYTEDKLIACPAFGKSGLITHLSNSQGYIRIPRGTEGLKTGQVIDVVLF